MVLIIIYSQFVVSRDTIYLLQECMHGHDYYSYLVAMEICRNVWS